MKPVIKRLQKNDLNKFIGLIKLFEDVFEMQNFKLPNLDYLQKLLDQEDFYVFVALADEKIVGGLTAYTLQQYYSERPLVYIFDLAVDRAFQRKGIGTQLMDAITDYCKRTGVEEIFVQADKIDDYAIDFYRKTGARPEEVVHFYYPLNS